MNSENSYRFVSRLTRRTLALVLAGGRGTRLKQLTDWRAKPAMPFGGKFRIIDFPLSNCINSGIRQIAVLTQYKSHSLIRHIQKGWSFLRGEFGEFVELMPAAQQRVNEAWYQGTADAVCQNLNIIRSHNPEYILVLAGDHIYKMDYGPMIAEHVEKKADMTVGCLEVPLEMAKSFGVMSINDKERIMHFTEKPVQPEPTPNDPEKALASMGIYVFNAEFLYEELQRDAELSISSHDFGKDIIPSLIGTHRVFAYRFRDVQKSEQPYWRDVGTVDAFWEANMELVSVTPHLNLYDQHWPIWTYQEQLPPAKFVFNDDERRGMAVDSMVSGGCLISGAKIKNSLLFSNVKLNSYSSLKQAIVLPDVEIGRHCSLKKVIIDKGVYIPPNTVIGQNLEEDAKRFYVSEGGVVVITPQMLGQQVHNAN
ncbi:glucose-1-phosphate adenylyltransferase [Candidatus Marithioploca araucensis]|uniref:Glucose-1-phosphate adenylyltransferase n=1 Tax=Candidatus Marithioploca araucensis TaxID=70273 RepID=A0ABT7VSF8_9GAMM|nr:glucose-1-phosphate adenylyltransferase [Candidatus Marithioploca araucensis]